MKKAFIKGYKALRDNLSSANPYLEACFNGKDTPQYKQWSDGWVTAFVNTPIDGKVKRRIPKSYDKTKVWGAI